LDVIHFNAFGFRHTAYYNLSVSTYQKLLHIWCLHLNTKNWKR